MKTSDIRVDQRYTNGKGLVREVLRIESPLIYSWEEPYVKYIHRTGKKWGESDGCYISSFARWAKSTTPEGGEG